MPQQVDLWQSFGNQELRTSREELWLCIFTSGDVLASFGLLQCLRIQE